MFTFNKNLFWAAALGTSTLFLSCKKAIEVFPKDPAKYARLESITFKSKNDYYTNRIVSFNASGEPVSSISQNTSTGDPNEAYFYHGNGQLKESVLFFGETPDSYEVNGNNIFILYTYAYDAQGRIIADTNHYIGGRAIDSNRSIQYYRNFTYDSQNRVIAEVLTMPQSNYTQEYTYEYDANGNLKGGNYDNKINPLKLSKVLAFIARDYSRNNPVGDDFVYQFNAYGLPSKIIGSSNVSGVYHGLGEFDITYSKK